MKKPRVRFAPSPTGLLHVGGARTALFNWLFARHEGGEFIIRIEDTDEQRSTPEFERMLLEDIRWLGLEWDEGPDRGGPRGPYRQTERMPIYRERARALVESGRAFPCFCTDEELEAKRERMKSEGKPPQYDGTCRGLSEAERELKRSEGRPESVRFRVEGGSDVRIEDIARGEVVFPQSMVGDFVILRSNGLPTYNFAATVDDALMEITHVIRGAEHLSNTLRQIMIYEALGTRAPAFAHIPLILGSDRTKLSKRHGAPNIRDYRDKGYPPEALINYLAFLGWATRGSSEILTTEELVGEFELGRVSDSPSIFDEAKLNWVSSQHIRNGGPGRYLDDAIGFFPEGFRSRYSREELSSIFGIASENLPCFSMLGSEAASFAPGAPPLEDEALKVIEGSSGLLAGLKASLEAAGGWGADSIREAVSRTGKELGVKGKGLYMPLRAALTGTTHGPDLTSIMLIRGKEDVLASLEAALKRISG